MFDKTKYQQFWSWVKTTFTIDYRKEIEAYLSEAKDHSDLQNRMEVLQRRGVL